MSEYWFWLIGLPEFVLAVWGTRWLTHPDHRAERLAFFSRAKSERRLWSPRPKVGGRRPRPAPKFRKAKVLIAPPGGGVARRPPFFPRRGRAPSWTSLNPVLMAGEFGYETDTCWIKVGDGTTPWNDLPYSDKNGQGSSRMAVSPSLPRGGIQDQKAEEP